MRYMKRQNLAPVLAVTAIAALALLSISTDKAEAGTTHTVLVKNNFFQSSSIQIDPGDTVEWLDGQSTGSHTVTQCSGAGTGCPGGSPGFNTAVLIDPAGGYLTQSFPDVGTFFYRCQVHPSSMNGTITVGSPTTATPTPSPTASPSPSPTTTSTAPPTGTATASPATVTPTASPTATSPPGGTATATATASPAASTPAGTATPAPTLSGRSDVNCDGETNGDDVLALLLHSAETTPAAAPLGNNVCAPIGSGDADGLKGDLNCDGLVDARDALVALYGWAGLTVPGLPEGCLGP